MAFNESEHPILLRVRRRRDVFRDRNLEIHEDYKMYFQADRLKDEKSQSIATSDVRAAADLAIHILSRHPHQIRLPRSIFPASEQLGRDKSERFLRGLYRSIDVRAEMAGKQVLQEEMASWSIITGWIVQFTALLPDAKGFPKAYAQLIDPSAAYPWWEGVDGELSSFAYEYNTSAKALKLLAQLQGATPNDLASLDDDQQVAVMDYWNARYNTEDPDQPDILNQTFFRAEGGLVGHPGTLGQDGWETLQGDFVNLSPHSLGKDGGFPKIPFKLRRPAAVPVASAHLQSLNEIFGKTTGGFVGPMRVEWLELNKWLSLAMQDTVDTLIDNTTTQVRSESGEVEFEPSERGKINHTDADTEMLHPLARATIVPPTEVIMVELKRRLERLGFPETLFGAVSRTLTGVAIDRLNEGARARVEPHKRNMESLFSDTSRTLLNEYLRRWEGKSKGRIKLQGFDSRAAMDASLFDEEFTPADVTDTNYVMSTIKLALPEDTMTKASISRNINPDWRASFDFIRETIWEFQDVQLEADRSGQSRIEGSPFWVNKQMAKKLTDEVLLAQKQGDKVAERLAKIELNALLQSLTPQEGRGIPEQPSPGGPEVPGALTPGAESAAAASAEVAASAGPGAQDERNV